MIPPSPARILALALAAAPSALFAQDLSWDTDTVTSGAQGAVTSPAVWNATNPFWWNGTGNVGWTTTRNVIFGGTPGVVQTDLPFAAPDRRVTGITFSTGTFAIPATSFNGAYELKGSTTASRDITMYPNPSKPPIHTDAGVRAVISFTETDSGLGGFSAFTKTGAGTLYLQANSTTATSPMSGQLTVVGGTLVFDSMELAGLAASNPYPTLATTNVSPIQIQANGTLIIDRSHALGGSSSVKHIEVLENGVLQFANARQQLHSLRLAKTGVGKTARHTTTAGADESDVSAILTAGAGTTITVAGIGAPNAFISTDIDVLNGPLEIDVANSPSATTLRIDGSITSSTGATHSVTKKGDGTLDLESENSFAGDLVVERGRVVVKAANALGAATNAGNGEIHVETWGIVDLNGIAHTRNKNWIISGVGQDGQGVIRNGGGHLGDNARIVNLTLTDESHIGGAFNYNIGWNPATASAGAINGNGHRLIKYGTNEVRIRGNSTNINYRIENGTLIGTSNNSFPAAVPVTLAGGALKGGADTIFIASPVTVAGSATLGATGSTMAFTGNISHNSGTLTLDADGGSVATFSGNIVKGKDGGAMQKTGKGTVAINGTSPSPATIVDGTLRGNGTLTGACTVQSDATLAPGQGSTGNLTINGNLEVLGKLTFRTFGSLSTLLTVNGAITLGSGAALELAAGNTYNQPVYILAQYTSLNGSFTTLSPPPAGYIYDFNYQGNNQIALVEGVADPYDTWIAAQGLAGPNALPNADPDGDGLANIIEFVLGTQPNPANGGGTGAGDRIAFEVTSSTHVTFRFARQTEAAYLLPVVRYGGDLANANAWPTAVHNSNGVTITTQANHFGAGIDRVNVTIPRNAATRLFARLAVP